MISADASASDSVIAYHLGAAWEKPILLLISLGFFGGMVANNTFGSRLPCAFARNRMVPASDTLTKLTHDRRLPFNTILVTSLMAILALLLNLGVEKVYATS